VVAARDPAREIELSDDVTRWYIALTARFPNLFIDTTMAFTSTDLRTAATAADIEAAGAAIVYGSDYPNIPFAYGAESAAIGAIGLQASTVRAILCENARRLSPQLGPS